jgi:hypothetical protein
MTQAARSGKVNIVEGSARSATSKETEMKLTDVARASLNELVSDYEDWLLMRNIIPWHKDSKEAKEVLPCGSTDRITKAIGFMILACICLNSRKDLTGGCNQTIRL